VLALYFGGEWCPHCVTFKPTVDRAYTALKRAHGAKFEIVYVSSDQDQAAFDHYFGQMDWLAVPYDASTYKRQLDERFSITGIPTVIMLRRDPPEGGPFVVLPNGTNGRAMLGQPPAMLVADFPWGAVDHLVMPLQVALSAIEQNLSLVVMCEHMTPGLQEYKADLLPTLELVAQTWGRRTEVLEGRWPALQFLVAHGPPCEPTSWLRSEAQLQPFETCDEPLEVLLIDDTLPAPLVYSMRALFRPEIGQMPPDRSFSVRSLVEEKGRLLTFFLVTFCERMQQPRTIDDAALFRNPPVCVPFGGTGTGDGLGARIAEDAASGGGVRG